MKWIVLGQRGKQELKDVCKEMVKVHKRRGMVQAAVAEGLSALGEEVDAIA